MAAGCPKLHQFKHADKDDSGRRAQQAPATIGKTKSKSYQDERERMFAILTEV